MDYQDIERSIIKKYRKDIWSKFVKAIIDYELIQENDKVINDEYDCDELIIFYLKQICPHFEKFDDFLDTMPWRCLISASSFATYARSLSSSERISSISAISARSVSISFILLMIYSLFR